MTHAVTSQADADDGLLYGLWIGRTESRLRLSIPSSVPRSVPRTVGLILVIITAFLVATWAFSLGSSTSESMTTRLSLFFFVFLPCWIVGDWARHRLYGGEEPGVLIEPFRGGEHGLRSAAAAAGVGYW